MMRFPLSALKLADSTTGRGFVKLPLDFRQVGKCYRSVLFLDELPEFNRRSLEVLRQPLELGHVTISRAVASTTFPASFILVAAMNPCP
jgi:predicted ATPase with chaperone activity